MTSIVTSCLLTRSVGAVLVLTLSAPNRRNALSPAMISGLRQALTNAHADSKVAAVVLAGADGFFCSGGDLTQLARHRALTAAERRRDLEQLHDVIRMLRSFAKPVIGAVEGGAAGAGVSLALACDLLVADAQAHFSVAYVKAGLTPDGGVTTFLAHTVSRQLLMELCLTGDRITAERLHGLGVVNRLTQKGMAEAEAIALASRLAGGPQQAIAAIKRLGWSAMSQTLETQLDLEAELMVQAQAGEEAAEGIAAYLDKRPADFVALRACSKSPRGSVAPEK